MKNSSRIRTDEAENACITRKIREAIERALGMNDRSRTRRRKDGSKVYITFNGREYFVPEQLEKYIVRRFPPNRNKTPLGRRPGKQ